jgi:hypothetical protein
LYHYIRKRAVITVLLGKLLRWLILKETIKKEDGFDLEMDIYGKMIYFYSYWMSKSKVELWDKREQRWLEIVRDQFRQERLNMESIYCY